MKIALSNPFWWSTFSFLYFSCCFSKEPEQETREGGAGSWGAWKVQEPSGPQAKHHGPTNPTCRCLVWGTKYSLGHPSAGQCMPTCADQLEAGQPLHWREENTRLALSQKKIHLWVICTWGQDIASCQPGWKALMNSPVSSDTAIFLRMFCTFGGGTIYFTGAIFQWKYALYSSDTRQLL